MITKAPFLKLYLKAVTCQIDQFAKIYSRFAALKAKS